MTKLSLEHYQEQVRAKGEALDRFRLAVRTTNEGLKRARAIVAKEVLNWQATFPPITADAVLRENIARDQARKLERVAQGLPPNPATNRSRPASSLDAARIYSRGGTPDDGLGIGPSRRSQR